MKKKFFKNMFAKENQTMSTADLESAEDQLLMAEMELYVDKEGRFSITEYNNVKEHYGNGYEDEPVFIEDDALEFAEIIDDEPYNYFDQPEGKIEPKKIATRQASSNSYQASREGEDQVNENMNKQYKVRSQYAGNPNSQQMEGLHEKPGVYSSNAQALKSDMCQATVIGVGANFKGDLQAAEDVVICGGFEGTIHLGKHRVIVAETGVVKGNLRAKSVIIKGKVQGDVIGTDCVSIGASGRMVGNVKAAQLSIEDGALFKGAIEMDVVDFDTTEKQQHPERTSKNNKRVNVDQQILREAVEADASLDAIPVVNARVPCSNKNRASA